MAVKEFKDICFWILDMTVSVPAHNAESKTLIEIKQGNRVTSSSL